MSHNASKNDKIAPVVYKWCLEMFEEMGITEYDDSVLPMLKEFADSYLAKVLLEAVEYSSNGPKKDGKATIVTRKDLQFAVQDVSNKLKGPKDVTQMMNQSAIINSIPLPAAQQPYGIKLPKTNKLTNRNYQVTNKSAKNSNESDNME